MTKFKPSAFRRTQARSIGNLATIKELQLCILTAIFPILHVRRVIHEEMGLSLDRRSLLLSDFPSSSASCFVSPSVPSRSTSSSAIIQISCASLSEMKDASRQVVCGLSWLSAVLSTILWWPLTLRYWGLSCLPFRRTWSFLRFRNHELISSCSFPGAHVFACLLIPFLRFSWIRSGCRGTRWVMFSRLFISLDWTIGVANLCYEESSACAIWPSDMRVQASRLSQGYSYRSPRRSRPSLSRAATSPSRWYQLSPLLTRRCQDFHKLRYHGKMHGTTYHCCSCLNEEPCLWWEQCASVMTELWWSGCALHVVGVIVRHVVASWPLRIPNSRNINVLEQHWLRKTYCQVRVFRFGCWPQLHQTVHMLSHSRCVSPLLRCILRLADLCHVTRELNSVLQLWPWSSGPVWTLDQTCLDEVIPIFFREINNSFHYLFSVCPCHVPSFSFFCRLSFFLWFFHSHVYDHKMAVRLHLGSSELAVEMTWVNAGFDPDVSAQRMYSWSVPVRESKLKKVKNASVQRSVSALCTFCQMLTLRILTVISAHTHFAAKVWTATPVASPSRCLRPMNRGEQRVGTHRLELGISPRRSRKK